ncbi:hypothetical protein [Ralstonia sp. SA306]
MARHARQEKDEVVKNNCKTPPSASTWVPAPKDASSASVVGLRPAQLLVLRALGTSATAISVAIAAYAGQLRGDTEQTQFMWIALSVVAVLALHLLPMFIRQAGVWLRVLLSAIWIGLLVFVIEGQVTFVLVEQLNAGDKRAMAVPVVAVPAPKEASGRTPTVIAQDAAKISAMLAAVSVTPCPAGACTTRQARKAALSAQLAALDVEASEAKRNEAAEDRWQAEADRVQSLRDARRVNPVASSLSSLLGTTEARLNLILAFMPTIVLDGVAVVCWLLLATESQRTRQRAVVAYDNSNAVAQSPAIVVAAPEVVATAAEPVVTRTETVTAIEGGSAKSDDDQLVDEIRKAVAAGRLVATQAAIRKFLQCGQPKAGRLNRLYVARFGSAHG